MAVNMHYPSRKGKKNPKSNSEIIWAATSTTGPECKAWVARLPPSWSQRKETTALQEVHKNAFINSRVGRTLTESLVNSTLLSLRGGAMDVKSWMMLLPQWFQRVEPRPVLFSSLKSIGIFCGRFWDSVRNLTWDPLPLSFF